MSEGMTVASIPNMRNAGDHFADEAVRRSGAGNLDLWGGETFSFDDLLDLVNPLQHIPIVSNWYRSATGDQIGAVARIVGGVLLGGPIGAVSAVINSAVESETGKDIGEHALALLNGEESFGGGEAPLLASMGDRSGDFSLDGGNGDSRGFGRSEDAAVQSADRAGDIEIEGLPWMTATAAEAGPVLTAAVPPETVAREIAAEEVLPWLQGEAGTGSVSGSAAQAISPLVAAAESSSKRDGMTTAGQTATPGPWVADVMMNALDKYGAMARQDSMRAVDSSV